MQSLAELLPELLREHLDRPEIQQEMMRIAWNQCVGQKIRAVSKPFSFHNGILVVEVSHSQWKTILASMKGEIVPKINRYLGKGLLKDLQITVV